MPARPATPPLTPGDLRAALDRARDAGESALRDAVRTAARRMRAGEARDYLALAKLLFELADHPSPLVRQEVAEAADTFVDPLFDRAVTKFSEDADHYVRAAIARAAAAHAAQRKEAEKEESEDEELAAAIAEIEARKGKSARPLVERALRIARDRDMRRVVHELKRAKRGVDAAAAGLRGPYADDLRREIDHLWAIVLRAEAWAREVKPRFAPEPLHAVIEEARGRIAVAEGDVALVVDVPVDLVVEIDRHALSQAIENVLKNAVESYAPGATGTVRVHAARKGAEVVLAIADQGAGMDGETRARLFVPFSSNKPGGWGVGMAMTWKMVVDVHGGTIGVESARGAGTTITFTLPLKQPSGHARR